MKRSNWFVSAIALLGASNLGMAQATELATQQPSSIYQGVNDFLRGDREDRGRGGTGAGRPGLSGAAACLVNPGLGETVWNLQPMLVMHGPVEAIALRPIEADPSTWQSLTANQTDIATMYVAQDEMAVPGETYEWLYFQEPALPDQPLNVQRVPFVVMPTGPKRDRITQELENLDAELQTAGADESAIAATRSNYFFANDLPADGFQALFTVADPSPRLEEVQVAAIAAICAPEVTGLMPLNPILAPATRR